jgi:anti-anti-sigma factor
MATSQGIVRYHQQGPTVTFRVEGRATMTLGAPLRQSAEGFLQRGAARVLVDLRDCTYMDSTFLGTLLTLKKAVGQRGTAELVLVAPSTPCARILHQMGLDDVLPAQEVELDLAAAWVPLPAENDPHEFRRNITQAHEELARLPGPAGEQFQAVIRCMKQADKEKPPS